LQSGKWIVAEAVIQTIRGSPYIISSTGHDLKREQAGEEGYKEPTGKDLWAPRTRNPKKRRAGPLRAGPIYLSFSRIKGSPQGYIPSGKGVISNQLAFQL
jgi:hypothetical protein